jgi:hypothetical protein
VVKTHVTTQFDLVPGQRIHANALPDPFDELDLRYRPKLQMLPRFLDGRTGQGVMKQEGESCTGHAVAALIDTVTSLSPPPTPGEAAPPAPPAHASPYMLYRLARKYDEFPGDADVGSSLRGALKGWYHHGVCDVAEWGAHTSPEPNLDNPRFIAECMKTPLGAYYRVNARRIDDMQSALTELNAVAVSAAIHEGWRKPKRRMHDGHPIWVISRPDDRDPDPLGGHAFLLAGYNDVGFLVQNSWGEKWGRHGYATLPYDDWLDNAYDAWVARPGVPQAGIAPPRRKVIPAGGGFVVGTEMDLPRLASYVIDVTAGGLMDTKGKTTSSPAQIAALAAKMRADIDDWAKPANGGHKRRLVLYAHGGLVGEDLGITIADRMIDWWRENYIYPVHIVWESDALTTIMGFLQHQHIDLPFGGILDGFWEAADTLLEIAGRKIQQLWREMKANARLASAPWSKPIDASAPGVTAFISHLKAYYAANSDLEVHLVGHSAGSVMLAGVAERLVAEGIKIESLQLMGGAISIDEFLHDIGKHLVGVPGSDNQLKRFTAYDLRESYELDDVCPGPPTPAVYHKSLLYFVARALEPDPGQHEKPMVGLARTIAQPLNPPTPTSLLDLIGGPTNLVLAPNTDPRPDHRSGAKGHGDFDNDVETMTSVLLRILNTNSLVNVSPYPKNGLPSG